MFSGYYSGGYVEKSLLRVLQGVKHGDQSGGYCNNLGKGMYYLDQGIAAEEKKKSLDFGYIFNLG